MTRTALPAGLLAGAAVLLVAIFVFGLGSRPNKPAASVWVGESASPRPSATPSSATPSSSPVASHTASPAVEGARNASVVAMVPNCSSYDGTWPHAILGNDLFVLCYSQTANPYIARVNLTTNKVVTTYQTNFTHIQDLAVDGGSLWYDGTLGSGCIAPCTGFHRTERVSLSDTTNVTDLADWALKADGLGYVWASNNAGKIAKLDPATGVSKGVIPFKYEAAQAACGSLWGLTINKKGTADVSTTLARVDPADGTVLASFTEPGVIGVLQQVGSACWAPALAGSDAAVATPLPAFNHFARIGPAGIEFRNDNLPVRLGYVTILDGTFWLMGNDADAQSGIPASHVIMTPVDPTTLNGTGPNWSYAGAYPQLAAGGDLWAANDAQGPTALERLDVPLAP